MSFEADNTETENTLISQNNEMLSLLKAMLAGIEIIANREHGSLLEDVDTED